KASVAPAASLASSALITFLTAVRSCERWATLRALRTTVCLARFLADLMLATGEDPGKSVGGAMKTARWQACPRTKEYGRLEIMGDSMAWVNMSVFREQAGMAKA